VANNRGVLVDAGPLVAILSERDQYHAIYFSEAKSLRGPFYTSWPVVTEAAYLLRDEAGAVEKLLGRIRDSKLQLISLGADDADGISAILKQYADQDFGLADATLMYLADRTGIERVFTIDQRHFSLFRMSNGRALALSPDTIS
jgi:hypothetical protein